MRVLFVSKIFPNSAEPNSAPFNRQQIAHLREFCEVEVLATIPSFPFARLMARWSSAGRLATVPREETIDGHVVRHPRTWFVPRLAPSTWGPLYAASLVPEMLRYRGQVDVVFGAWAYPDGVGALALARALGVPCVIKVHGSDINAIAQQPGPRRQLAWALPRAARVVTVSRALSAEVAALGVPEKNIALVTNGVDTETFRPQDRAAARTALGLGPEPLALYVGNLKKDKGVLDLAAATLAVTAAMPEAKILVVGDGDARVELAASAAVTSGAMQLCGARPHAEIGQWLAAADILVLPSWAEGTPNVVLEALASGRRVVATRVGGTPDVVDSPELGELVAPRAPRELAEAILRGLRTPYDPVRVATLGARGGWRDSARRLADVLTQAVVQPHH